MSIQRLSTHVAAQVQASIRITSLGDVVLGLLDNALNAEARKVKISLDLEQGFCTVEDDGLGIESERLADEGLIAIDRPANQYQVKQELHTGTATFLTSVAALSMIAITSKHHQHYSQNSLVIHHGRRIVKQHSHAHVVLLSKDRGTTVTVRDLFGLMPVRIKHRTLTADAQPTFEHEWFGMKQRIIALLLAKNMSIDLTIREVGARSRTLLRSTTNETANTCDRIVKLLCLSAQFPYECRSSFVPAKASTSALSVKGLISMTPAATKSSQFISINARPCDVDQGQLFDIINQLFDSSDFGLELSDLVPEEVVPRRRERESESRTSEPTKKHLKGLQKGIDRWPVFYLRIETKDSGNPYDLQEVARVVQCLVHGWLEEHHFRPHKLKQKKDFLKDQRRGDQHGDCTSPLAVGQQNSEASMTASERPSSRSADWSRMRSGNSAQGKSRHMFRLVPLHAGEFGGMRDESVETGDGSRSITISEPLSNQSSMSPAQLDITNTVPWRHLRTGETLQIDSRTGMIKTGGHDNCSTVAMSSDTTVGRSGRPLLLRKRLANAPSQDVQSKLWMDGIMHDWTKSRFLTGHSDPIATVQPPRDTCQSGCRHGHARKDRGEGVEKYSAVQLSKSDLRKARVIAQVDRKYILAILGRRDGSRPQQLVLIDQHAASERCILEELLDELCRPANTKQSLPPPAKCKLGFSSGITTVNLTRALSFQIPSAEHSQLEAAAPFLAHWGILYNLNSWLSSEPLSASVLVTVISLPPGIVERCTAEPKLIERLLRDEARNLRESTKGHGMCAPKKKLSPDASSNWVHQIGACPKSMIDLLNSRACRSAIMFNDPLTLRKCEQLVGKLGRCAFPFICAHGRVSMVPLVDLGYGFDGFAPFTAANGHANAEDTSLIDALTKWKTSKLGSDGQPFA